VPSGTVPRGNRSLGDEDERMRHCALHLAVLHGSDVTHQAAAQPPLTQMAFTAPSLLPFARRGDEEKARDRHDQAL